MAERGDEQPRGAFLVGLSGRSNAELLAVLDCVLVELERRLLRYASSAAHAASHLQVLGVGDWSPRSTNPGWSDDARVTGEQESPPGQ
jgi:hypothetical protein